MVDGSREYLEAVTERVSRIQDDEIRTLVNELRRACLELTRRVEELEANQIVFVPEFLDS